MPFAGLTVLPTRAGDEVMSFDSSSESSTESLPDTSSDGSAGVSVETDSNDNGTESGCSALVESNTFNDPKIDLSVRSTKNKLEILLPPMISPKSSYIGWEPPMEVSDEEDVLRELICDEVRNNACFGEEKFTSLRLEQFVIYRPPSAEGRGSDAEFVGLQNLCVRRANTCYLFDGVLSVELDGKGCTRYYVEKVPFENLSIGGYGDDDVYTVKDTIWIQSKVGKKNRVWYQLCSPAKEYKRFHEPFTWLATFAKHFMAFMDDEESEVTLQMFKSRFSNWVYNLDEDNAEIQAWAAQYSDTDFRRVVTAHFAFLNNEARQIDSKYLDQPIWSEVDSQDLTAVPRQPVVSDSTDTVVTPLVYECFSKMAWQKFMAPVDAYNCPPGNYRTFAAEKSIVPNTGTSVQKGDVVELLRDDSGPWRTSHKTWFAYVQEVVTKKGKNFLRILWLYRPEDTICSNMHYPFEGELFLSDHCACDRPPIPEASIVRIADVSISGSPDTGTKYFIRQRYSNEAFETLVCGPSHFHCNCNKPIPFQCQEGQTVLINHGPADKRTIEVVELRSHPFGRNSIRAHHLVRRREFGETWTACRECPLNELVYTGRSLIITVQDIIRPCHVRFFTPDDEQQGRIPPPFSRGGTGDAFFIIHEEIRDAQILQPLRKPFSIFMLQSFVPPSRWLKRLRTLDLFCGGGNFGRGMEEGGVATVKWAVDYDDVAMHSYRANLEHPHQANLFLGSVNDYLRLALTGTRHPLVAMKGEVDMILAGSPCQGFSLANKVRSNSQGLQNQSMIASVASFIDFYRPKYALFENVKNMSSTGSENAGQNVFSQMICTLVGMGYQVHQFCVDAWSVGSPQSRTRLFIAATAPGYVPLRSPPITHAHPSGVSASSIGKTANGLRFGARDVEAVSLFPHATIGEATADLDYNFDGRSVSIKFPDHRVVVANENTDNRLRTSCIPRNFPKAGLGMAVRAGLVPQQLVESLTPKQQENLQGKFCGSCKRNHAQSLVPTVTTRCNPMDQYSGRVLHWECDRAMTVLEVRRAQGFPDREIIVGTPAQQWKIVGNSVARPVALALGMSVRNAWLEYSFPDGFPNFRMGNMIDYTKMEDPAPNGFHLVRVTAKLGAPTINTSRGGSEEFERKRGRDEEKTELGGHDSASKRHKGEE